MASPEPSFEGFFSTQQRPSTQSSFDLPSKNYHVGGSGDQYSSLYNQSLGDAPIQYADEPQTLEPRDHRTDHLQSNDNPLRKDSVPFDPSSSSTLIASVANGAPSGSNTPGHYHDPNMAYQHQQSDMSFLQHQQGMGGGEQQYYDNSLSSAPQTGDWNNSMLQQQQASDAGSRRASFTGLAPTPFEDPEQFEELQRIISNASSHGQVTPGDHSRAASPFIPADQPSAGSSGFPDSARSPSPFVAAPSPPIRSGSTTGSPSFSKPQSPPALVIPNSAPSPQYQPMAAVPVQPPQPTSQFGNSLLPPANPALSGMAGISPIADNADGPMITIQPSTPISGLREGNGVFDAALRRANAQAAQANQQQTQANGVQPASMATSQSGGPAIPAGQQTYVRDPHQWSDLGSLNSGTPGHRARAKSESYGSGGEQFDRQAMFQVMNNPAMAGHFQQQSPQPHQQQMHQQSQQHPNAMSSQDQWINTWRMNNVAAEAGNHMTMDPRQLPGQGPMIDPNLAQMGAQPGNQGMFKYESGQISPTSMAMYQQLGLNATGGSVGGSNHSSPGYMYQPGVAQPVPQSHFLIPEGSGPSIRRRSFAEGTMQQHHAAGVGTPGYGVEFTMAGAITPPGRLRAPYNHRRAVRSEDFSRFGAVGGTGWGMGQGGSTSDFLHAITNPDDGTLLPPTRGRSYSHSRHSSASSVRSASPALSVSSQGSSYSHHSHMDMPEHMFDYFGGPAGDPRHKVAKLKVTSMATEVASQSRRTNSGIFKCPIPGCGSTFTRHFNLKGHLRSHNDERPYKCLYDGCPKAIVGFARQHDCKRHMLLHEGLRPFECEGCGKKFARLDALTRHHKSEQGQECAISHPLPTNPDGSAMSESQYKAYRLQQMKEKGTRPPKLEDMGQPGQQHFTDQVEGF